MAPKLTEVFKIDEAPIDYKKSLSRTQKAAIKAGADMKDTTVLKGPKPPPTAKNIRKNSAEDDPMKNPAAGEVFTSDHGVYVVFKQLSDGRYESFFVEDMKKVTDLGNHADRKTAIDAVLEHHDKKQAKLESKDEEENLLSQI